MKNNPSRVRLFSERQGLVPEKPPYQEDSLDEDLRKRLWNILFEQVLFRFEPDYKKSFKHRTAMYRTIMLDFHNFASHETENEYIDELYDDFLAGIEEIYIMGEWYKVFDFIEFIILLAPQHDIDVTGFIEGCNTALEKECSVYRVVDGKLVRAWEPPGLSKVG